MGDFERQQGVAFLLIFYSSRDEYYYLRYEEMMKFWKRAEDGGIKRFRIEELDPRYFLTSKAGVLVPYLEGIQKDLENRG